VDRAAQRHGQRAARRALKSPGNIRNGIHRATASNSPRLVRPGYMDGRCNSGTTLRSEIAAAGAVPTRALLGRAVALLRSVGPYAALELLLPGGSLLALLLWLYRHRAGAVFAPRPPLQSQHISCC
jgi:hypothetical protein